MNGYEYWQAALGGQKPRFSDQHPQPGYYKVRGPQGVAVVGIWEAVDEETGEVAIVAHVGPGEESPETALSIWLQACRQPITYEAYEAAMNNGGFLPEEAPQEPGAAPPPPVGHNKPPEETGDPFTVFSERLSELNAQAAALLARQGEIADSVTAEKVATVMEAINKLKRDADEARKAEKRPHDDAAKAVQGKWLPLIDKAGLAAGALNGKITAYLKAEEKRVREEARRKAEEAAAEAARRAEEARRAAAEEPEAQASLPEPEPPPPEAFYVPPESVKIGGTVTGRRTALTTKKTAKIVDYDKLVEAVKSRDEVRELMQTLADRAARAGNPLPGTEIEETRTAR